MAGNAAAYELFARVALVSNPKNDGRRLDAVADDVAARHDVAAGHDGAAAAAVFDAAEAGLHARRLRAERLHVLGRLRSLSR